MDFPVIAHCDTLVLGAGAAGMALAERQAALGRRVVLAERRSFPMWEMGAWHRPWLVWRQAEAGRLRGWFPNLPDAPAEGEVLPLVPDALKLHAEQRLLNAGVRLLYAVQPVAAVRKADGWRVTLGCKSGLYTIHAGKIADNTETGILRYIVDESQIQAVRRYGGGAGWAVCAEVEGEIPEAGAILSEPPCDALRVHPSAFSPENHILEFRFGPAAPMQNARELLLDCCARLFARPGWQAVRFGACSLRPMPMLDFDPAEALALGEALHEVLEGGLDCVAAWPFGEAKPPLPVFASTAAATERSATPWPGELRTLEGAVSPGDLPALRQAEYDLAVCGAGPCGAVCAAEAAKQGLSVLAAEMNDEPGGAGTAGGIHTYWYGHRRGFTREIDDAYAALSARLRQPAEFYVWGERDSWNPALKAGLFLGEFERAGVQFLPGSFACAVLCQGARVSGVLLATPHGPLLARASVTADCTGDADLARLARLHPVEGSEKDAMTMWASMAQYKQSGRYRGGIFTTTVDVSSPADYTRFILLNRRRGTADCYDHGVYVTPRESRHLRGEYTVDIRDVVLDRRYPDTVLTCFSNFDTKGKSWADLVYFGFLPAQVEIDLPYRALLPPGVEGLLVGGRAVAATHDAASGIRMQDDMQNLGGAMGLAAALAVGHGGLRAFPLEELQRALLAKGALEAQRLRPAEAPPPLGEIIAGLTGDEPFEAIDMDMNAVCREVSPIVRACLAPSGAAVPPLLAAFAGSTGRRRLLLARLLLWHRDPTGADDVLAEVWRMLEAEALPTRHGSVKFCQPYPDHGVMAELSYLVCLLARGGPEAGTVRVLDTLAERITDADRDYLDRRSCIFGHVESVAFVAARRGSPAFLPALRRLAALPEFDGIELYEADFSDLDITRERIAYLKLLVAEALARCGSAEGYRLLAAFLPDVRRVLARCAARLLAELLGLPDGDTNRLKAAGAQRDVCPPKPYHSEIW